ncbi:uncharacterized protein LOC143917974 [Arctopsyche grandis]|uniref:uncharacterized protein LOC143917974 n=1 Tax=Arctopsyche grandis TaxID=121162 RepID=UPI00406D6469
MIVISKVLKNRKKSEEIDGKKSDPTKWKQNVAKKQRSLCLPYTIKNKMRDAKAPKSVNCSTCRFKCAEHFTEENRRFLCANYWKLADFKLQKDFILSSVVSCPPKRRLETRSSNRKARVDSKQYYFEKDNAKIRVCQTFFRSTLSISPDIILNAFQHKGPLGTYGGIDGRGKKPPANKTSPDILAFAKRHIESFPTMELNYYKKSTKRKYLDGTLSITKMYELYVEKCKTENKEFCSAISYRRILGNDYNLSFFRPKKNQCTLCTKFNQASDDTKIELQTKYDQHQLSKEECNTAKINDKKRATGNPNFVSLTFDLNSVLQIPSADASPMYYSRKVSTYNLTVYESMAPNNVFCFCWTELNGKRGSSEIGSCLFEYLTKYLPDHVTEVSMFSDSCGGQNRNQHLAALMMYVVQVTNIKILEHKFLESGHNDMEIDSMHNSIEKVKKYVSVYTMHDWLSIFNVYRQRTKANSTYQTQEMKFNNILDLEDLSRRLIKNTLDINGEVVKWFKIKSLKYTKQNWGEIQYKYKHADQYSTINVFDSCQIQIPNKVKILYKNQLPISEAKKRDLVSLCHSSVIPEEFHAWYLNLPTCSQLKDTLQEPCVGDESETENPDE